MRARLLAKDKQEEHGCYNLKWQMKFELQLQKNCHETTNNSSNAGYEEKARGIDFRAIAHQSPCNVACLQRNCYPGNIRGKQSPNQ